MDFDVDVLLSSLMAKHSEDGEKWNKIVQEYNEVAPEAKSKHWLKNRSKKICSAPAESEKDAPLAMSRKEIKKQANVAANCVRTCVGQELSVTTFCTGKESPQGCSFAEFSKLYHEILGDPRGCNLDNMHAKMQIFSSAELREVMRWQKKHGAGQAAGSGVLVPHVKNNSYLDFFAKQRLQLPSQPLTAGSLHGTRLSLSILCMHRSGHKQFGDKALFSDTVWINEVETKSTFNSNLVHAFRNIISNSVEIQKPKESVLSVRSPKDCCVLSRLVLPSFIDHLLSNLEPAGSEQELVIIPYAKDQIYATLCSSPRGCFGAGELIDAKNSDPPDGIASIPFRIHSSDRSSPELSLLANGVTPVSWDVYSHFGTTTYQGTEDRGVTCFPIPRSKQEVFHARKLHAYYHVPSSEFAIHDIGKCWADYFACRGLTSPFANDLTSMLTFPLTVLYAIRMFRLEFDVGTTVRIDIPGSREQEMQKGIWNELRNGLASYNICLRLVGPELEEAPAVQTGSMTITSHKCMYEDLIDQSDAIPHLVVAFNAGICDSWMPVVTRIIQKKVPMAITGFDIIDVASGLTSIWTECDLKPQVVHDGLNPFGCAFDMNLWGDSSRESLPLEATHDLASAHPVIEHAHQLLEAETELDTASFVKLMGAGDSLKRTTINKAWLLIRGQE